MLKILTFALTFLVSAAMSNAPATAQSASGQWAVTLTKKQAKALASMDTRFKHRAFAISPDGAWGRAWDNSSKDDITSRALSFCRQYLKKGRRDCFLYTYNGTRVAPAVVETKVVRQVYKPVNGKTAPQFFGRLPFSFNGNKAAALADYEALVANPNHARQLKRSSALQSALTNASFMNTSAKGFAIWFGPKQGSQFTGANSGVLRLFFSNWIATPDGLVCMFNSTWDTGKQLGTRCLILESVQNGAATFYWDGSANKPRKGQIIAGDARYGAAR